MVNMEFAQLFRSAGDILVQNQVNLNCTDTVNGNHGDHMVEIFQSVVQVAQEHPGMELAEAMEVAGLALAQLVNNGSAQVYSRGLTSFAFQFRKYDISMLELISYVRRTLSEKEDSTVEEKPGSRGVILKALVAGLAGWQAREKNPMATDATLDLGYLFDLGLAYLHAKQHSGNKLEALVETVVSASPLGNVAHRLQSGKLAVKALLQAMSAPPASPQSTG